MGSLTKKVSAVLSVVTFMSVVSFLGLNLADFSTQVANANWGPGRTCYRLDKTSTASNCDKYIDHAAEEVVFNSFIDLPTGDERNFMQIKDKTAGNETYSDTITLQTGHEYEVYIHYHNNASSGLNEERFDYAGIAHNVTVTSELPAGIEGVNNRLTSVISADNATPSEVFDDVTVESDELLSIVYSNDAKKFDSQTPNGGAIGDITEGANIGDIKGCNEFAGYITYSFKAEPWSDTAVEPIADPAADNNIALMVVGIIVVVGAGIFGVIVLVRRKNSQKSGV